MEILDLGFEGVKLIAMASHFKYRFLGRFCSSKWTYTLKVNTEIIWTSTVT